MAQRNDPAARDESSWTWDTGALRLEFRWDDRSPVRLAAWEVDGLAWGGADASSSRPIAEVLVRGHGRAWNNTRLTHTATGQALRHVAHAESWEGDDPVATIVQRAEDPPVELVTRFRATSTGAVQVTASVSNLGSADLVVDAVPSVSIGALVAPGEAAEELRLVEGRSEQLAEFRWSSRPLRGDGALADVRTHAHANQSARGIVEATGLSTWSTAALLPAGMLVNERSGRTVAWQVENNGAWHWEVDDIRDGVDAFVLVLSGPTDLHHQASVRLAPGERFETVPASVCFARSPEDAVASLTRHRRRLRAAHSRPEAVVVYNDYMNTLDGDPSEAADAPLLEAAARVGADVFCIDAGWYADAGIDWWSTVGDWEPSLGRFPSGLGAFAQRIRDRGMIAGIWMEPEVVGVGSEAGRALPDEAFLQRGGVRIREHDRWFLDLRSPAARRHLDRAADRLLGGLGFGYVKLDYNVTPGSGTDRAASSAGHGLLEHSRAYLAWFGELRRRYPHVVFENCGSGAMRADFAQLEVFDLQSTSDQQDPLLYPVIAAGAPMMMPPELAGNWAYAQPTMSLEQIAFTTVTGLAGQPYLSGFYDRMTAQQLALVADGVRVHREIRADVSASVPWWPAGFPAWDEAVVTLCLRAPAHTYVYVWNRAGRPVELALGAGAAELETVYPVQLPPWGLADVAEEPGTVRMTPAGTGGRAEPSARVYRFPAPHPA
ncbi:glycoside hydrolase family 36 protein [Microbacterium sp. 18062]|uniref:glycoside hydrolase family 36 protein n=1 Tax=Microbacterium sp. 18062 TaxID=2681410 RepID=UPI00135B5219|nr:glycoside hydrolase family 36 protein [Microbacterium sp. 18062]